MRLFGALTLTFLAYASWAPLALAASCRDIATVDFRNEVILAARGGGKIYYNSSFNGTGPGGPLRFRNGVFLQWDISPGELASLPAEERKGLLSKPDWKTTIDHDVLLRLAGSKGVRILTLNQDHLTGTGSFTYVLALECRSGAVRKTFEASGEGVQFERATSDTLEILVGVWSSDDAHCCPSREEHVRYHWSPSLRRFVRASSKAACQWLP